MSLWGEGVMWYVYTVECCTAVKVNELNTHDRSKSQKQREKLDIIKYILYDSIYMQF